MKQFTVAGGTLAAKPVNDQELLTITMNLPIGFGYILAEIHLNINVDTADDWNEFAELIVSNPTIQTAGVDYRLPIAMANTSNDAAALNVRTSNIPAGVLSRIPIIPAQASVFTQIRYTNLAAAVQAAGTVDAVVSFWEFDLEQISYFAAHSAMNVLTR